MRKLFVIILAIILATTFAGCTNNGKNESKITDTTSSTLSSSEAHSSSPKTDTGELSSLKTTIDDYTVVDENESLQINKISDKSFQQLQKELDTHKQFGKGGMELALIDYEYSICELRKVNVKDKTMYYCAFSDSNDKTRIYIFFWKLNEWSCYDYVKMETGSTKESMQQDKDIVKYISPLDL